MSGLQNNPQNNASPHSAEFSCAWAGDIPDSGGAGRDIYAAASCDSAWRNAAIRVGRDIDDAATRDFAGHLDDFRIYGRALAAGEALGLVSPVSTVSRQYVWGLYIDELLQQKNLIGGPSGGAAGQEAGGHYLMSDLLYRAAALVTPDSGETSGVRILENYDFDAYGNTLIFNAPGTGDDWWASDAQQTPTPACRYLFTGREYDAESGLYYYRARFYWPELGRFGQRDTWSAYDVSLYQYCASCPVMKTDSMGLHEEDLGLPPANASTLIDSDTSLDISVTVSHWDRIRPTGDGTHEYGTTIFNWTSLNSKFYSITMDNCPNGCVRVVSSGFTASVDSGFVDHDSYKTHEADHVRNAVDSLRSLRKTLDEVIGWGCMPKATARFAEAYLINRHVEVALEAEVKNSELDHRDYSRDLGADHNRVTREKAHLDLTRRRLELQRKNVDKVKEELDKLPCGCGSGNPQ